MTIRAHHLPLPGGAPAPKKRGSLPPFPPASYGAPPHQAGGQTPQGGLKPLRDSAPSLRTTPLLTNVHPYDGTSVTPGARLKECSRLRCAEGRIGAGDGSDPLFEALVRARGVAVLTAPPRPLRGSLPSKLSLRTISDSDVRHFIKRTYGFLGDVLPPIMPPVKKQIFLALCGPIGTVGPSAPDTRPVQARRCGSTPPRARSGRKASDISQERLTSAVG